MKTRQKTIPRSLVLSFQLRPGTTKAEAEELAGMVAAAVDDAAGVCRALRGSSPFDGPRASVLSSDASVVTLH